MNSCLYETQITHQRLKPKVHKLQYRFFSFYLDLDELPEITRKIPIIGFNRPNLYSFYDKDHLQAGSIPVKDKILGFISSQGVKTDIGRIMLLTYLRTFGHVFNPVSFYFCFDKGGLPAVAVVEIGNTFGEVKPFLIGGNKYDGKRYVDQQTKYYYISPFTNADDCLDFSLALPGENLSLKVDTIRDADKYVVAVMTGLKKPLDLGHLLWFSIRFPFETLGVIFLIHWHAMLLYLKKIPFHLKESQQMLQKGVYRAWHKA